MVTRSRIHAIQTLNEIGLVGWIFSKFAFVYLLHDRSGDISQQTHCQAVANQPSRTLVTGHLAHIHLTLI